MTSAFNLGWLNFSILLRSSDLDLFSPFFPSDLQIGLGQNELLYGIIWVERCRSQTKKRRWHYYRHNHNCGTTINRPSGTININTPTRKGEDAQEVIEHERIEIRPYVKQNDNAR